MFLSKYILAATALCLTIPSLAYGDERYAPVDDPVVQQECGDCHMVFAPQMLPKRSWVKIMSSLDNHFGENATLDADLAKQIEDYLTKHAADSGWYSGKFMRGVEDSWTPLRITETPYWVREHKKEVRQSAWSDPKIKTKANCMACHPYANKGYYDDD